MGVSCRNVMGHYASNYSVKLFFFSMKFLVKAKGTK